MNKNVKNRRQTSACDVSPSDAQTKGFQHGNDYTFFKPEEIITPSFDRSTFSRLAIKNASQEEIFETANKYFDSFNIHLFSKSQSGEEAYKSYVQHLAKRQDKLQKTIETLSSFRVIHTDENLVKTSFLTRFFSACLKIVIFAVFLIEWSNEATIVQLSGEQTFFGTGGYLKAIMFTAVLPLLSFMFKSWMSELSEKAQKVFDNIFVFSVFLVAMYYLSSFANYFGWEMNDTTLEMPPGIYKKIIIFCQVYISLFSLTTIFNILAKKIERQRKIAVFRNEEFQALKDELNTVITDFSSTDFRLKHTESFRCLYESKKESFAYDFYGKYSEFYADYLTSASELFKKTNNKDIKKPNLRVVKGEKK